MVTRTFAETPAWIARKARTWQAVRAAALSALLGAGIWAISPGVFGHPEPWDGNAVLYYQALFGAGLLAALMVRGPFWSHYLGSVVGQSTYAMVALPLGPLAGLGVPVIALFSALVALGALLGAGVWWVVGRLGGRA